MMESCFHNFENGISPLYDQFIINLITEKVDDMVVPIPNTSRNAHHIFQWKGIKANLIYIDASHAKKDVIEDGLMYKELLLPGGFLFGDDYGCWESVKEAADYLAETLKVPLEVHDKQFWSLGI
jgi:phosphoribosylformylglycinamidine (FGAM) synthase-like amidotransferase family enzyme